MYKGDTRLGFITLNETSINAAAMSPSSMTITFDISQVSNGDSLMLKFEDVVYNGRETVINANASVTYTK